jgi:hypothetical protein
MKRFDKAAMKVIDDNHVGTSGTFTYDLHERLIFSRGRLKTLIEATDRIAAQRAHGLDLDPVTATKLFDIYDYIVRCSLLSHFDPQDGYQIRRLPAGKRRDWNDDLDELHLSIWSCLSGALIPKRPAR